MLHALMVAYGRFGTKNGWVMSSHVAMSLMMALFPFMIFTVALAGLVARGLDQGQLIDLTLGSWPDVVADPLERELRAVIASNSARFMSISGALALYFASNGIDAIAMAMARSYHGTDPRPFWRRRLISIASVIVGAGAIVLMAVLLVALPVYLHFLEVAAPGPFHALFQSQAVRVVLGVAVIVGLVWGCHRYLPGGALNVRRLWPGIVLTIAAWALAAQGFGIYLTKFASYSATYAGLAGAMSALIFLYLLAAFLIFGAEFNAALAERSGQSVEAVES